MSYPKIGTFSNASMNAIQDKKNISNGKTFIQCVNLARRKKTGFFTFKEGTCYPFNNYDPVGDSGNMNDTPVYATPDENCTENLADCLRDAGKKFLVRELNQVQSDLKRNDEERDNLRIREIAIKNNYTFDLAKKVYESETKKNKLNEENKRTSQYLQNIEMNLGAMNSANQNSNMSLTDKNRVLATINSDVQNKNQKLMEVNDKINTITQDIYYNNITDKRKNQMIGLLKAITTIIIILMFCMIIYYGVKYANEKYGILDKFKNNKFNNNNNFNF